MLDTETNKNVTYSYLLMNKSANASGAYNDGIYIKFGDKSPQHITLSMYSENPDIETCDLRLTTVNTTTNTTAASKTTNVT
jgi:hypothetical protein